MPRSARLNRRSFVKRSILGTTSCCLSWPVLGRSEAAETGTKPLRFGLIADIHKDVMHDADRRLQTFINHMTREKVDFIVQIGDFCVPKTANQGFLNIWNEFKGPRYHVLGNHDMDGGYQREQTVAFFGMPSRYYSFTQGAVKFVVLDGNDKPADHKGGYPRFIAQDQAQWLGQELAATKQPTIILVHQSLERENKGGVQNGKEIRAILERANQEAGFRKVVACFSGHHHRDYVRQINNIVYPQINSASYYWVGGNYLKVRYSPEIDAQFPYIKYTVPYKDPVYAIVTIDADQGFMRIDGQRSEFVGPPPWELGETKEHWDSPTLTPNVSDWKLPIERI